MQPVTKEIPMTRLNLPPGTVGHIALASAVMQRTLAQTVAVGIEPA